MDHNWVESSGTTLTCNKCGCVYVVLPRVPRRQRHYAAWNAREMVWRHPFEMKVKEEPPCLPEQRGHTVPDWLRDEKPTQHPG